MIAPANRSEGKPPLEPHDAGGGQSEKEPPPGLSRAGLTAFRGGWTAFMVVATSAPYLLNWLSTPAGFHYTWILPPYPEDSFGYLAWSQEAARGSLLFQMKYTALPHTPFLFHPFFLICGWIGSLLACDLGVVHLGVKAAGVALFFVTFFRYADYLELSGLESSLAAILLGVSSGMGGLLGFFGLIEALPVVPVDLWLVDSNTYWSLLWNPLFPYSLTLLLLAMFWLDRGTRDGRKPDMWLGGLAAGILALIHPYSQPSLLAFALVVTIWRRKPASLGYLCRFVAALFPFALYVVLVAKLHPLVSRHGSTGEMKSPPLPAYLLGFGLPLLLAAAGLAVGRGQWTRRYWPLILWFLLSLGFSYLPVWFQRKLIFGAHIPLCILAATSAPLILSKWSRPQARRRIAVSAAVILLPLLAATPIYLLVRQSQEVRTNADSAYFVSAEVMQGLAFLKARSRPDELVFAEPATSRLIPAFAGNTVVWGHWAQSVDGQERMKWFADLGAWDDDRRVREFWGLGIKYIFADGAFKQALERSPGGWSAILRGADRVFDNDSVAIYRRRSR